MKSFKADDSIDSPSSERKEICKTIRSWELEILPKNLAFGKTLQYGEREITLQKLPNTFTKIVVVFFILTA